MMNLKGTEIIRQDSRRFIDILRGIAVFLTLWGHCIQCCSLGEISYYGNAVFKIIYSFHMPLFMLISGYLFFFSFRKRNLKELVIHRTQALLQPIIMCSILRYVLTTAYVEIRDGNYASLFGGHLIVDYFESPWFLWSVLAASLAVAISCKITHKKSLKAVLLILGFVFVALFPSMDRNIWMYPYFIAGFVYAEIKDKPIIKKISCIRFLSIPLFPIIVQFYREEHFIYTTGIFGTDGIKNQIPVDIFRWAIGLVGSLFVICLLELCYIYVLPKMKKQYLSKGFEKLGQKSLQVWILSTMAFKYFENIYEIVVDKIGVNFLAHNVTLYSLVYALIIAVVLAVMLMLVIKFMDKTKLSLIFFGK